MDTRDEDHVYEPKPGEPVYACPWCHSTKHNGIIDSDGLMCQCGAVIRCEIWEKDGERIRWNSETS